MQSTRYFLCRILMKLKFSQQIFVRRTDVKFNQNPSSGGRVVEWGHTDMTKLIVALHNFANAPLN